MNWRKPIVFALLRATGSGIPGELNEIRRAARLSEPDMRAYQCGKLRETLQYAARHVPYYRKTLEEAGAVVDGEARLENFHRVPLLTKEIIRHQGAALHAEGPPAKGRYENTSGGSTGVPVRFLQDRAYDVSNTATKLFFFERLGKEIGAPEIKLWGSDRDILAGNLTVKDRIINYLYNRHFFNCYHFPAESMRALAAMNNAVRPESYWAYVDASYEFAKFALKNNLPLLPPKVLVTTIGPLYPDQKEVIEKAFGCRVYNQYGSREVGVVCCHDGTDDDMRVFFWRVLLEILPVENGASTDEGKIVLTSLDNRSMPLIRYEIGDVALKGALRYDLGGTEAYLSVKNVVGRTLGFFRMADGTLKHTHFLVQQLFFRDWIARFQVAQEALDRVVIRIVLAGEKNEADMAEILEKCRFFLGGTFRIEFEFVDRIAPSPSGKVLYTVCNI